MSNTWAQTRGGPGGQFRRAGREFQFAFPVRDTVLAVTRKCTPVSPEGFTVCLSIIGANSVSSAPASRPHLRRQKLPGPGTRPHGDAEGLRGAWRGSRRVAHPGGVTAPAVGRPCTLGARFCTK